MQHKPVSGGADLPFCATPGTYLFYRSPYGPGHVHLVNQVSIYYNRWERFTLAAAFMQGHYYLPMALSLFLVAAVLGGFDGESAKKIK